jgi:hypothetical protein
MAFMKSAHAIHTQLSSSFSYILPTGTNFEENYKSVILTILVISRFFQSEALGKFFRIRFSFTDLSVKNSRNSALLPYSLDLLHLFYLPSLRLVSGWGVSTLYDVNAYTIKYLHINNNLC